MMPTYGVSYSGQDGSASWEGRHIADVAEFKRFLKEIVRPRMADEQSPFEPHLRGLATTGMSAQFVEKLLKAVPEAQSWEIGEAIAECTLGSCFGGTVHWPWNMVRDRRTPSASLPGADLVGFFEHNDHVVLLFGEVKTSADKESPPNVMYGRSGMIWQLQETVNRRDIQKSLLQWLQARCSSEEHRRLYTKAVSNYITSQGKELLLVGVLVRDTPPAEKDLKGRGMTLSGSFSQPTRSVLIAWYCPLPLAAWAAELKESAP